MSSPTFKNYNDIVTLLIIIVPPLVGILLEGYKFFCSFRQQKSKKKSFKRIAADHIKNMFTDSIFCQDKNYGNNQRDNIQNRHSSINNLGDQIIIPHEQQFESEQNQLQVPLVEKNKGSEQELNNTEERKNIYFQIIYYLIVVSNIFALSLIYMPSLYLQEFLKQYVDDTPNGEMTACIISSFIIIVIYFIFNFCMFMYGSIITGQGVLLLLLTQQRKEDMNTFLISCVYRSGLYSALFMVMQIFLYVLQCIQEKWSPEEFQKNPLILIQRYVASLFISHSLRKTYSNQKVFKKKRQLALFEKFYNKYYNINKLHSDFTEMQSELALSRENQGTEVYTEEQKQSDWNIFLRLRMKQAQNYVKRMETNLQENKNFKLDNILTNKDMKYQIQLSLLYQWIFIFTQVIQLGIAIFFLICSIPFNYLDYISTLDFNPQTDSPNIDTLNQTHDRFSQSYYLGQNNQQFHNSNYIGSDSIALFIFNLMVLLQYIFMPFIRFSLQKKWILNENTKNFLKK